ncbi:hypothetical protein D3C81_1744010 [compost metagenome]
MLARNSLLAWAAFSARSLASITSSSSARRRVMSRITTTTSSTWPFSSVSALKVHSTQMTVPSLCTARCSNRLGVPFFTASRMAFSTRGRSSG